TSLSQGRGNGEVKTPLDDLRSQEVVHADEADGAMLAVDDDQARDLVRLHHVERFGGELVRPDQLGCAYHQLARPQLGTGLAREVNTPEVAVRKYPEQAPPGIHDGGHAEVLARHLGDDVLEERVLPDDRD